MNTRTRQRTRSMATHRSAADVMQISCDPSYGAEDWYGRGAMGVLGLGFAGKAPKQPVREQFRTASVPVVSAKGVSKNMGRAILAALIFLFAVLLLVNASEMLDTSNRVTKLSNEINDAKEENERLRDELTLAENSVNVGYEAAQRGMIASRTLDEIQITLPPIVAAYPQEAYEMAEMGNLAAIGD